MLLPFLTIFAISVVAYSKQYSAGRCSDSKDALNLFNLALEEIFNATLPALHVYKNVTFSCELARAVRDGLVERAHDVFIIPDIRVYRKRPEIELVAVEVSSYAIYGFTQKVIPPWYESILQWFGWDLDSNYVFGCYYANVTTPEVTCAFQELPH